MHRPVRSVRVQKWRAGESRACGREVPDETAVALVYDGSTHAVMMATPADLADFAHGFSLAEGIVSAPSEIESLEIVEQALGLELRMWLAAPNAAALAARRRRIAGPTGCGLCGIDSLAEAMRGARPVSGPLSLSAADIAEAAGSLRQGQALHNATHATHAAAFWSPRGGLVALREDVGRHNALDKLIGALALGGVDGGEGAVVVTSRVSIEIVQKAAVVGAPILIAVSAPTGLAVAAAREAGITLVALARGAEFEVFTHAGRITLR